MRIQEVKLDKSTKRYMLLDDKGLPIIPVVKYLKYLDNGEKSYNTQKTYCYSLKLYFEYIKEIDIDYRNVNLISYLILLDGLEILIIILKLLD